MHRRRYNFVHRVLKQSFLRTYTHTYLLRVLSLAKTVTSYSTSSENRLSCKLIYRHRCISSSSIRRATEVGEYIMQYQRVLAIIRQTNLRVFASRSLRIIIYLPASFCVSRGKNRFARICIVLRYIFVK